MDPFVYLPVLHEIHASKNAPPAFIALICTYTSCICLCRMRTSNSQSFLQYSPRRGPLRAPKCTSFSTSNGRLHLSLHSQCMYICSYSVCTLYTRAYTLIRAYVYPQTCDFSPLCLPSIRKCSAHHWFWNAFSQTLPLHIALFMKCMQFECFYFTQIYIYIIPLQYMCESIYICTQNTHSICIYM